MQYNFSIQAEQNNNTLRDFLRSQGISLTHWRKIKSSAQIFVNDKLIEHLPILYTGDRLKIVLPDKENANMAPEDVWLDILYEDEYLLAVNKPAGMLVHPTVDNLSGSLGNAVMGYYQKSGFKCSYHPLIRLDKYTSGIVLIAKQPRVQHMLSKANIHKEYLLLVHSEKADIDCMINAPIARGVGSIILREVNELAGKEARTHFKSIAVYGRYALIRAILYTGRTHQIRVHAQYSNMPIVGDSLYGLAQEGRRYALHAHRLLFYHPISGQLVKIRANLPGDIIEMIAAVKNGAMPI